MYNTDIPSREELPSTAKLIKSTFVAIIVAAVLLVTVVMPAEYGIDPTGAGKMLGLTEMGEIKEQLAEEAAADAAAQMVAVDASSNNKAAETTDASTVTVAPESTDASPETMADESADGSNETAAAAAKEEPTAPQWQDEVRIVLTPGEGTEYKLTMDEGAVARFSWVSEGGPINYDTHGNGSGQSISYEKGRGVPEDEGELIAAFTGKHGWFFRNRNDNDITLVLKTGGDYGELQKVL